MDIALKLNVKGLKFQNWMYLMLFSVIILVVLWALQFLLLEHFHHSIKLNELGNAGDKITEQLNHITFPEAYDPFIMPEANESVTTPEMSDLLNEKMIGISNTISEFGLNNNYRVFLLDESGKSSWSILTLTFNQNVLTQPFTAFIPQKYLDDALQKLLESEEDRVCYLYTSEGSDTAEAIYITKLPNGNERYSYLYIYGAIPPIDATASVLKTQFIIITIILFGISLFLAQVISAKMAKPIIKLTKSSERLVKGELDETFYEEGFTEIRQLATAFNYASGELRSLDNYRREFIANISHDLKTPLTIIKFYGEMIRDVSGNDSKKRIGHCDTIIKEADRLTDLVDELLALSKIEDINMHQAEQSRLNLSLMISDILVSFEALSIKEGYVFECNIDDDLYVLGNEPTLRRAVYNLIGNAVNFTGEDKRIFISLKERDGFVHFEVTDTGEGIYANKQSVIWDRYYKSNEAHKRAVVGTGLGLSIVKSILTFHSADYGVISEPGQGSTFWFALKNQ